MIVNRIDGMSGLNYNPSMYNAYGKQAADEQATTFRKSEGIVKGKTFAYKTSVKETISVANSQTAHNVRNKGISDVINQTATNVQPPQKMMGNLVDILI